MKQKEALLESNLWKDSRVCDIESVTAGQIALRSFSDFWRSHAL